MDTMARRHLGATHDRMILNVREQRTARGRAERCRQPAANVATASGARQSD
jgi:hypothetical protein